MCYICAIGYTRILKLSYQIDIRKLRFYHKKFTTASVCGIDCIVWHSIIATSKRVVDILLAEYSIVNFASDAVYLSAVWSKFAADLRF